MNYMDGLMVLSEGRKAENDARLWQQYLSIYPHMTPENFISYAEYREEALKPAETQKNTAEIMLKVKNIINLTIER